MCLINKRRKRQFPKSNSSNINPYNGDSHKGKKNNRKRNCNFLGTSANAKSNLYLLKKKKRNYISYSHLALLSEKHPDVILLSLLNKRTRFLFLIKQKHIKQDFIPRLCIVLGKASTSDLFSDVNNLIKNLCRNGKFILYHVQRYFIFLQRKKKLKEVHHSSIFYSTVFLEKFQNILPSESSEVISNLLPLLDSACEKCLIADDNLRNMVSTKLKEIEKRNEFPEKHFTFRVPKKEAGNEKMLLQTPPENFRTIPVLPTVYDITLPCSFLRPNIIKGKYEDVEHYLDVQYRLLREDYVQPLRDAVTEYLSMKQMGKCIKKCQNARIYYDVYIKSKDFEKGNLIYCVQFSDKSFSNINWRTNKRFLPGSLLCFSTDDFQTAFFASVFRKNTNDLKKGLLFVKFEESAEDLNIRKLSSFVVIEASSYFEAYRHNLSALKELDSKTLVLKKYFVDLQKDVSGPSYLCTAVTFDMRPLLLPFDKKYIKISHGNIEYEYPKNISSSVQFVNIMDDHAWPKPEELNLDHSQYTSLKSAFTKELAIIQGPPGTGKTYIGLRVVQLLLHNLDKWCPSQTSHLPILVVCYTNHALDQFLEGLLLFTKKICRIGGRVSNKNISRFNLSNLRKHKSGHNFRGREMFLKWREIDSIEMKIGSVERCIEVSRKTVLTELELHNYISDVHRKSLTKNGRCTMYDWLYINVWRSVIERDNSKCNFEDVAYTFYEINESESETVIDYIKSQRSIGVSDDYDDFYLYKNLEPMHEGSAANASESESTKKKNQHFKLINYIKNCLERHEPMNEEIVRQIDCVWSVELDKRWRLYKYWLQKFIEEKQYEYLSLQEKLKAKFSELAEFRMEKDVEVLKQIHVVGMTTTGAAKYRHLVQRLEPIILIAEEAAEVLESHIITSLAPTTEHVILIGDHQQLRPAPTVHALAVKYNMNISLFERMIKNDVEYCRLSVQHRMRPEITSLIVPHIYSNLENHKDVTEFENIKGVGKNVFFVSHNFSEFSQRESTSKVNKHEAKFIIQLCRYFLLQGYDHSQITVLTTYSGQLFALKNLATDEVRKVHFTVVDNFQGEENDIILLSLVRSNSNGVVGFLKVPNRVCVALSRAKKGLFCIGNFELLAQKSDLWKSIVETLNQKQLIGSSLQLICQNHPDMHNEVATEADFKNVPNGGCNRNCEYQLPCGHTCTRKCHPYDQDHKLFRCEKPCSRTCERGHPCDKEHLCFKSCYCEVLVEKKLQRCGHIVEDCCGKSEEKIICKKSCERTCKEGHVCRKRCFEFCGSCSVLTDKKLKYGFSDRVLRVQNDTVCRKISEKGHICYKEFNEFCGSCDVIVDKTLDQCGHTVKVACGSKNICCDKLCTKTCERCHQCQKKCYAACGSCQVIIDKTLDECGHTVQIACSEKNIRCYKRCSKICKNGHQCFKKCFELCGECQVLVDKTLNTCGHTVKVPCSETNIQCKKPCIKTCQNGHLCSRMCFQFCSPCEFLVDKKLDKCGHTVKASCWKSENDISCYQKCEKKMLCSHECPNKCGDICVESCEGPCLKKCEKGHPCHEKCFEECGPCVFLIYKTLERCGHTIKAPCGILENKIKCSFNCKETLRCSHSCTNKCGEPCIETCMELIETRSPLCGHVMKVRCYIASSSEHLLKMCSKQLFKVCLELCNVLLPCGHVCKGTCGRCYQRRLHVACQEMCERILICGHKCMSTCSKSCPPCQLPCENKCSHTKCPKNCSEPCLKCTKTCEWSCSHKRCTRPCNEMCNRGPCDQPCPIILPCGHTCIGFCGEPCPKECRICDDGKGYIYISGSESCRYVLLENCNHVFDVNDLDQWMRIVSEGTKDISMKVCRRCKTVIRKSFRYNNIIKACSLQLEKVKQTFKWNRENTLELQKHLLQKSVLVTFFSDFKPSRNFLFLCLSSSTIRNIQELTTIENIISITASLKPLEINKKLLTLVEYLCITSMWLANFISKNFLTMSEYQLIQLTYEVHRLKLINELLKSAQPEYLELCFLEFETCSQCLLKYAPFDEDSEKSYMVAFHALTSKLCEYRHKISTSIEFPLLKAVDFSTGHWYECPQDHIFCITRYVENIEKSCYKCVLIKDELDCISVKFSNMASTTRTSLWPPHKIFGWTDRELLAKREETLRKISQISPDIHGCTSKKYQKDEKMSLHHWQEKLSGDPRYSMFRSSLPRVCFNNNNEGLSSPGPSKIESHYGTESRQKGEIKDHYLEKSTLDIFHSISVSANPRANKTVERSSRSTFSKLSAETQNYTETRKKGSTKGHNFQKKSSLNLYSISGYAPVHTNVNESNASRPKPAKLTADTQKKPSLALHSISGSTQPRTNKTNAGTVRPNL